MVSNKLFCSIVEMKLESLFFPIAIDLLISSMAFSVLLREQAYAPLSIYLAPHKDRAWQ
jgi:hypothetical protein